MKRLLVGMALLALAASLRAQEKTTVGVAIVVKASGDKAVVWFNTNKALQLIEDSSGKSVVVVSRTAGEYTFGYVDGDKKVVYKTITVQGDGVVPPKPVDPDDPPDPDKPPAPVKAVRVLIVYETADALPLAQQLILQGKAFRDHMKTKGAVSKEDPFGPLRIWDKDVDTTHAKEPWKALMARPRKGVPWIVIEGDGRVVHEGPLPADTKAAITLIERVAPKAAARPKKQRKAG